MASPVWPCRLRSPSRLRLLHGLLCNCHSHFCFQYRQTCGLDPSLTEMQGRLLEYEINNALLLWASGVLNAHTYGRGTHPSHQRRRTSSKRVLGGCAVLRTSDPSTVDILIQLVDWITEPSHSCGRGSPNLAPCASSMKHNNTATYRNFSACSALLVCTAPTVNCRLRLECRGTEHKAEAASQPGPLP